MRKEPTKRQMQAAATKKKIHDAGVKLFAEIGYDAVNIEDITKEAGVAKGSFYLYFLSKEDLFIHIMLGDVQTVAAQFADTFDKVDKSRPAADLLAEAAAIISGTTESIGVDTMRIAYKIFLQRSEHSKFAPYEDTIFIELYKLGAFRGEFIKTDAKTVAENIRTIMIGLTFEWCLYYPDYDFVGKTKSLVSDYLNSLKNVK